VNGAIVEIAAERGGDGAAQRERCAAGRVFLETVSFDHLYVVSMASTYLLGSSKLPYHLWRIFVDL